MSRKEIVEAELISRLWQEPELQALDPSKQDADGRPVFPFISVVAEEGIPYVQGGNIFRVPVDIEVNFNAKTPGQDGPVLDRILQKIRDVMTMAHDAGQFGVIDKGGGKTELEGSVVRKRTLSYEIICA